MVSLLGRVPMRGWKTYTLCASAAMLADTARYLHPFVDFMTGPLTVMRSMRPRFGESVGLHLPFPSRVPLSENVATRPRKAHNFGQDQPLVNKEKKNVPSLAMR